MCEFYCGPKWLPKRFRKYLSDTFNEACKDHDENYDEAIFTRYECDIIFLNDMLSMSETKFDICTAYFYFVSVRLLGSSQYNKES